MPGLKFSATSKRLDALAASLRAGSRATDAEIGRYISAELLQIRRIMRDATPVASTANREYRLPNGHTVTRKAAAPGSMRASWHSERTGTMAGRVWNDQPYAGFLFTGTRPHAIPRAFGYPAPFGDNPDFHPGTKPNQALNAALDRSITEAKGRLAGFGLTVVRTVVGRERA